MATEPRSVSAGAVEKFLAAVGADHHERTVNAYRADLADLAANVRRRAGEADRLTGVLTADLVDYLANLVDRGFGAATIRRRAVTVRLFYRFLQTSGQRVDNPADGLRLPTELRRASLRPGLSDRERNVLLQEPPPTAPARAHRDYAIIQLVAAGLSASDVAALDVADSPAAITPRVSSYPPAEDAVRRYLRLRPRLIGPADTSALFVNDRGQRLTRQGVWLIIQRIAQATGLARWADGGRLDTRVLASSARAGGETGRTGRATRQPTRHVAG